MIRRSKFEPVTLLENAALKCECSSKEIMWWSWPQTFPNTSGPHKGIAGQALTTFQVFGFEGNGKRLLFCDGLWKDWINFDQKW